MPSVAMCRRCYRDDDSRRQQLHSHFANDPYDNEHVLSDRMAPADDAISRRAVDTASANSSPPIASCRADSTHRQKWAPEMDGKLR